MLSENGTYRKKEEFVYKKMIILLVFLSGVLISQNYFEFMGLNILNTLVMVTFYGLLSFMLVIKSLTSIYERKIYFKFQFWGILSIAIILKFVILFLQFPSLFFPGAKLFSQLFIFAGNLLFMILLGKSINSISHLKRVIFALGLGASFSSLIPFLFFPEMMGQRATVINGYIFTGAFWNPSVISYISVGWLLISLATIETSKKKKGILITLFLLFISGSLVGLSRATMLSILISVIVYMVVSRSFVKYIKTITFVVLSVLILINLFPDAIIGFEQRLSGGVEIEDEARMIIWKDYLEDLPDYFLFGDIHGEYTRYSTTGIGPHSVILNWLTQFGFLAVIGFLVLIFGMLISIKKIQMAMSIEVAAGLYAWLAAYLSVALVNETGFRQLTVFGVFGIILAWGRLAHKEQALNRRKVN